MECCGKRGSESAWEEEKLRSLRVDAPDWELYERILRRWDGIAKPLDSMGRFERITARIGAILGSEAIDVSRKAVVIFCADNGIVEEGVSQSGQEVTAAVAAQMGKGLSSVGRMASVIGVDTIPIDVGIHREAPLSGVLDRKVCSGTRNFHKEPAMTAQEAYRAIQVGMETVASCKAQGYRLLATGEMGIGNTTTASAVCAALLGCRVEEVTGRGAGLDDGKLLRKRQVIAEAIERYQLAQASPFTVLRTVGGADLAGLAGICIGGARYRIPVVLDGVISMSAALLAERMAPGTAQYLIASHRGKEPATGLLAQALDVHPVIEAELALGEGTGAVMMFSLIDLALAVYHEGSSFADIRIKPYERYGQGRRREAL